jgi:hypothetical protein
MITHVQLFVLHWLLLFGTLCLAYFTLK